MDISRAHRLWSSGIIVFILSQQKHREVPSASPICLGDCPDFLVVCLECNKPPGVCVLNPWSSPSDTILKGCRTYSRWSLAWGSRSIEAGIEVSKPVLLLAHFLLFQEVRGWGILDTLFCNHGATCPHTVSFVMNCIPSNCEPNDSFFLPVTPCQVFDDCSNKGD